MSDKSKFDEGYEIGFKAGEVSQKEGSISDPRKRYHYLKCGGAWDKYNYDSPDDYLAGFLDAMKTLGVLP